MKRTSLIWEIRHNKRNKKRDYVKNTHVKPVLDYAKQQCTVVLSWDSIEDECFKRNSITVDEDLKKAIFHLAQIVLRIFLSDYGAVSYD